MKITQIERSGSTQTNYQKTPSQAAMPADCEKTERPDLVECVNFPCDKVVQVKFTHGPYAGTTGQFFAIKF